MPATLYTMTSFNSFHPHKFISSYKHPQFAGEETEAHRLLSSPVRQLGSDIRPMGGNQQVAEAGFKPRTVRGWTVPPPPPSLPLTCKVINNTIHNVFLGAS